MHMDPKPVKITSESEETYTGHDPQPLVAVGGVPVSDSSVNAILTDPDSESRASLSATIASVGGEAFATQTPLPQSTNVVGFLGDSLTTGSGASANKGYANIVRWIAGTRAVDQVVRVYATAGYTSAQVLATHVPTAVAGDAAVVHVQVGTNDAGQGTPVTASAFGANIIAMYDALRLAGKRMTIGLVPPRSSGASAQWRTDAAAYNEWIMRWAPLNGVPVADTHGALVASTGYLSASYVSGDGTHLNDLGYARMAVAVAAAVTQALPTQPHRYTVRPGVNLMPTTATPTAVASGMPSGWAEAGTGTAPTYSTVADTGDTLVEGVWVQMDWNATTGGTRTLRHGGLTKDTGWGITDQIEYGMAFEIEDVTGFAAALAAGTATVRLLVLNSSLGPQIEITPTLRAVPGSRHAYRFSGPDTTYPALAVEVVVPNGVHVKVRVSELAWVNLTAMGLAKVAF